MAEVLVIEDEHALAEAIRVSLEMAGHRVTGASSGEEALAVAATSPPDVVLLDLRLPDTDGMEVLRELQKRGSDASVIVMTAYGNVQSAVAAMKSGVCDYLTKPLDLDVLDVVVRQAIERRRITANLEYFRQREQAGSTLDQIIGKSAAVCAIRKFINQIVATPALGSEAPPTVLLTGETGTGKDLIARVIHYAGPRQAGPFVQVNCTTLPDHLVEGELFGHVKGAFTDAHEDKRGLFTLADGGTVFLDEIGHMKLPLQAKLLGVLERRAVRPVGGTRERRVNVHVIAATNRMLSEAIERGEFRGDLYHRVRVLTIDLPRLASRTEDIPLLAEHFLRVSAGQFRLGVEGFTDEAMMALCNYDWPGNVRELANSIESASLMADGPRIGREHLNIQSQVSDRPFHVEIPGEPTLTVDLVGEGPNLADIEYHVIRAALNMANQNVSRAARILGISRDAIRYRLNKYRAATNNREADSSE